MGHYLDCDAIIQFHCYAQNQSVTICNALTILLISIIDHSSTAYGMHRNADIHCSPNMLSDLKETNRRVQEELRDIKNQTLKLNRDKQRPKVQIGMSHHPSGASTSRYEIIKP